MPLPADLKDIRDRVARHLAGDGEALLPAGAVLTGEDVTPSRFLSVDWSRGGGIALFAGSPSSHVAMLARSRGVPMVVGLGPLDLNGHTSAIIRGDEGRVILSPNEADLRDFEAARTGCSTRRHSILSIGGSSNGQSRGPSSSVRSMPAATSRSTG